VLPMSAEPFVDAARPTPDVVTLSEASLAVSGSSCLSPGPTSVAEPRPNLLQFPARIIRFLPRYQIRDGGNICLAGLVRTAVSSNMEVLDCPVLVGRSRASGA